MRYCDTPRGNGEKQGTQTSAYSHYVRVLLYRVTGEYRDININGIQGIEDNYSTTPYSLIILLSNKKKDPKIYWINYWEWEKNQRHLEIFHPMINTFQISK